MARSLHALPFELEGERLVVAMLDPWDKHALGELARATHREILPRVARYAELGRAIEDQHPMTNQARRAPASDDEPVLELVQRRKPQEAVNAAPSEAEPILPLVRRKSVPTPGVPAKRTFERPRESANKRSFQGTETAEYSLDGVAEPAAAEPAAAEPAVTKPAVTKPAATANEPGRVAPPTPAPEPHALDSWGPLSESRPPAPPPRMASLPELGQTLAELRDATSRDEVVRVSTQAVCAIAHGAVLLAVRRDVLKGWDGQGPGVSPEAVRNLWIPVRSPGLLRDVLESGEHHVGPHGDTAADQLFRAAIAGGNGTLVVEGLKVAGRTVALLCADGVAGGPRAIERVEVLAQATAQALERLVREAKRER